MLRDAAKYARLRLRNHTAIAPLVNARITFFLLETGVIVQLPTDSSLGGSGVVSNIGLSTCSALILYAGLIQRVQRVTNDVIVIYTTSALSTSKLNLVFQHRVDRICRVKCGSLRDEVDFITVYSVLGLFSPTLDQVLEDAGARECIVLLDALEVFCL